MDEQELERIIEKLNNGLQLTDDEMKKLAGSTSNATKALDGMKKGLAALGKGVGETAKSMYAGQQGAKAFNSAMDSMVEGVASLLEIIPVVGTNLAKAVRTVGGAATAATKAINEMSDNLYDTYKELAKSGAAAGDGMLGAAESAQKMGYGLDESTEGLKAFTALMARASTDLAMMSGTVADGRKKFADISNQLVKGDTARQLMNMGFSIDDINKGTAGYLKLQTQIGRSQNMTTTELAMGAKKYLQEMDALTKITGMQREELEEGIMKARAVEAFRAKVEDLRAQGREEEAKQMEQYYSVLQKQAPKLAQGFAESAAGMIVSDSGRAFFQAIDSGANVVRGLSDGTMKATDAMTATAKQAGQSERAFRGLAQAGASGDVLGGTYTELANLKAQERRDFEKDAEAARDQQNKQAEGADGVVDSQTKMRQAQMDTRDSLQNMVKAGITPTTKAFQKLSNAVAGVAETPERLEAESKKEEPGMFAKAFKGVKDFFGFTDVARPGGAGRPGGGGAAGGAGVGGGQKAPAPGAGGGGGTSAAPAAGGAGGESKSTTGDAARPGAVGGAVPPRANNPISSLIDFGPGFNIVKRPDGLAEKQIGARNWRNNNPGNIEYGSFAKSLGALAGDPRFAIFPSYDAGRSAKAQLIFDGKNYRDLTLTAAISRYAPPNENDTQAYQNTVLAAVNGENLPMSQYSTAQRNAILDAMERMEGYRAGKTIAMADGGVIPATPGGVDVIAGEAGMNEAFVPLPDGKSIPVELSRPSGDFKPPSKEQMTRAYGDMVRQGLELIPGLRPSSDGRGWTTQGGSIGERLELAAAEMIKSNTAKFALKPGQKRDYYDWLSLLFQTPEGKVWAAENYIGVEDIRSNQSAESMSLRDQYQRIRDAINEQWKAFSAAGFTSGASIEDPLSRMEVLAEDYKKRQAARNARGIGDWQTGNASDPRLTVINEKVIRELQNLQQSLNQTGVSMADGGIATGPKSGYRATLHGNEAVIPLPNDNQIPVEMQGLQKTTEQQIAAMSDQTSKLEELIGLMRSSVGVQEKILRTQNN